MNITREKQGNEKKLCKNNTNVKECGEDFPKI